VEHGTAKGGPLDHIHRAMNDEEVFARWFSEASWDLCKAVLKGAFALSMTAAACRALFSLARHGRPRSASCGITSRGILRGRGRGAARLLASTSRGGRRRRRGDRPVVAPEFRNRLDAIVPFARLPEAVISRLVDKFILQLEAQLSLAAPT
jgi:hypothetical protein